MSAGLTQTSLRACAPILRPSLKVPTVQPYGPPGPHPLQPGGDHLASAPCGPPQLDPICLSRKDAQKPISVQLEPPGASTWACNADIPPGAPVPRRPRVG